MNYFLSYGFSNNIPIARKEIARLNKYSTPMGKLYCIQRLIAFLMRSPKSPASTPEGIPYFIEKQFYAIVIFGGGHICC